MMNCSLRKVTLQTKLLLLAAALLTVTAAQGLELSPFKATYKAFRFDDNVGNAVLFLEHLESDTYRLRYDSDLSKFFMSDKRFEESVFKQNGDKLLPYRYRYARSGTGPDKSLSVDFDTDNRKILIKPDTELPWQGELDNQLYRLDLPLRLAKGETEFSYQFINYRGQVKEYRMKVMGKEQLSLPYGMLEGIKVKIMRKTKKRETFAWFSPELNYTMVRLQQFKEGKEQADIRLSKFEGF